jgi:hypothetical protein
MTSALQTAIAVRNTDVAIKHRHVRYVACTWRAACRNAAMVTMFDADGQTYRVCNDCMSWTNGIVVFARATHDPIPATDSVPTKKLAK